MTARTLYTLYTPHSTLYTLHFTLDTPHSTLHSPHSELYTGHSTLHITLYTPHSTHYTLHSTRTALDTPHPTLHFTLHTPYTSHCTLHTVRSTLYTLQSTLYSLHFTLSPPSQLFTLYPVWNLGLVSFSCRARTPTSRPQLRLCTALLLPAFSKVHSDAEGGPLNLSQSLVITLAMLIFVILFVQQFITIIFSHPRPLQHTSPIYAGLDVHLTNMPQLQTRSSTLTKRLHSCAVPSAFSCQTPCQASFRPLPLGLKYGTSIMQWLFGWPFIITRDINCHRGDQKPDAT